MLQGTAPAGPGTRRAKRRGGYRNVAVLHHGVESAQQEGEQREKGHLPAVTMLLVATRALRGGRCLHHWHTR